MEIQDIIIPKEAKSTLYKHAQINLETGIAEGISYLSSIVDNIPQLIFLAPDTPKYEEIDLGWIYNDGIWAEPKENKNISIAPTPIDLNEIIENQLLIIEALVELKEGLE